MIHLHKIRLIKWKEEEEKNMFVWFRYLHTHTEWGGAAPFEK